MSVEERLALLTDQLASIQRDLEDEKQQRQTLETQVNTLQKALMDEQKKRRQITDWIKDNLGPNLEHLTEKITGIVQESSIASPRGTRDSERSRRKKTRPETPASPTLTRDTADQQVSIPSDTATLTSPPPTRDSASDKKTPTSPVIDKVNNPANLILERVEDHVFMNKEYYDAVPQSDAFFKANRPGRLKHFLGVRAHSQVKYNCPNLSDKAIHFANHSGGKLIFAPDPADEDFMQDNFSLGILPSDECYPVCPDGLVRSQIMYLVLRGVKRFLGCNQSEIKVSLPHGVLSGYDPYTLTGDKYKFISKKKIISDKFAETFLQTFGQPVQPRYGESKCVGLTPAKSLDDMVETNITDPRLDKLKETLREFFNLYYYQHNPNKKNRVVFFAFGNSVPILMDRLMEVNPNKNGLNAIPFGIEDLTRMPNRDAIFETYKLYASITGLVRS